MSHLIFVDSEEDEGIWVEGLDLHRDGEVARVVVPQVPLHGVAFAVEGVARVLDHLRDVMQIKPNAID